MEYSKELREQVVSKALLGTLGQEAIAKEFGIGRSTVQNWLRQYRGAGAVEMGDREKRPEDWTREERLDALIETGRLSEEELGGWCRSHGLHTHHLRRWREELVKASSEGKESQAALRGLREENRGLKKALRRKDKALAETAALLVLKKKAQSIWGEPEDD